MLAGFLRPLLQVDPTISRDEMTERTRASWLVYALGALCAGAIVTAVLLVGPASSSTATITRTAKVAQGVVQSTVSGNGNLQSASQLNLGFKTGGTVTHIYVTQGEHVVQGQLLATLDPQSAEVTLEQAKASLQSAEANLAEEQETDGESSTAASSNGSSVGNATASSKRTSTSSKSEPRATSSGGTAAKSTLSTATREANLASAKAAVRSDTLSVQSDEQAVQDTKLYAPENGTIVSLSGQVGEVVSASGTTRASSSGSSSSGSGSSGSGTTGASAAARSTTGSSSSASSTGSSSASFAILSDLSSMQLVVPLSESEIGNVKAGQIATVTVEALSGSKLAAHVSEVALLATSSSGAVSYNVTFQLDQLVSGSKLGMSATAEVVVKQAEGLNVPTSAISAGAVTVERGGKQVRQRVLTGLAGDTSTIISSGLQAGETVVLPTASTTSSSTGLGSRLGSRAGGLGAAGGLSGAGGGGFPGGGAAFFRGGG
jgi:membrane fusion protein, macrolide-specific efflux system